MIRIPAAASAASNAPVNLASRSRMRNLNPSARSSRFMSRLRACCVTHSPRRVGRDPGRVHAAGAILDDEYHVQAAERHGVDEEEIGRPNRLRLGRPKSPPVPAEPLGGQVLAALLP